MYPTSTVGCAIAFWTIFRFLKSHLWTSHAPAPPKHTYTLTHQPGFHKCNNKNCKLCHLDKKGTFTSSINITETGQVHNIKQHMTCKSSNVIYCVTCKKCNGQYIGETEQELHRRSSGHLSEIRHNRPGLPYVSHFRNCGIEFYSITGVEKLETTIFGLENKGRFFIKNCSKFL